jgi:hypothetical protein
LIVEVLNGIKQENKAGLIMKLITLHNITKKRVFSKDLGFKQKIIKYYAL